MGDKLFLNQVCSTSLVEKRNTDSQALKNDELFSYKDNVFVLE